MTKYIYFLCWQSFIQKKKIFIFAAFITTMTNDLVQNLLNIFEFDFCFSHWYWHFEGDLGGGRRVLFDEEEKKAISTIGHTVLPSRIWIKRERFCLICFYFYFSFKLFSRYLQNLVLMFAFMMNRIYMCICSQVNRLSQENGKVRAI